MAGLARLWNSLVDRLRDPTLTSDNFTKLLKAELYLQAIKHTQRRRDAS